jgi:hypothetical protein
MIRFPRSDVVWKSEPLRQDESHCVLTSYETCGRSCSLCRILAHTHRSMTAGAPWHASLEMSEVDCRDVGRSGMF